MSARINGAEIVILWIKCTVWLIFCECFKFLKAFHARSDARKKDSPAGVRRAVSRLPRAKSVECCLVTILSV